MGSIRKFVVNDILKNPFVKKYALWAYLIGSIGMMIRFGLKGLLIVVPLSVVLCCWIFWASGAFQEMKEGGRRIRWMMDARKAEKLKKKKEDEKKC